MSVDSSAINHEEGSEPGFSRGGSNASFEQMNTNMGKMFEVLQNLGEALQYMAAQQGRHHHTVIWMSLWRKWQKQVTVNLWIQIKLMISVMMSVICLMIPSQSKSVTLMLTSWMTWMTPLLWLTKWVTCKGQISR